VTAGAARRVIVVDTYPFLLSGSQRIAGRLAAELPALGWDTSVLLPAEGVAAETLRVDGAEVRIVPAPPALMSYGGRASVRQLLLSVLAAPRYWWRLTRVLRGFDVAWINDLRGMVLAAVPALLARTRVVWHLHAAQPQLTWLIPVMARLARVVVVPSAHATQGLRAAAVSVLPNPVAVPDQPWTDPNDRPPLVVSVGRLYRAKGYDVLLEACARLRDDGRTFRVVIAGGDSPGHEHDAEALRRRRSELSLDGVVEFAGDVADVSSLLRRAKVYVQPSRAETFGLATAEAMALGLPVVATSTGGLRDHVVDGRTGISIPVEDPAALAAAIARLLDDGELRGALGRAARDHAVAAFAADRFAAAAAAICTKAIA
jgi:glycosyltransferase involved in cell wall biosynthesis